MKQFASATLGSFGSFGMNEVAVPEPGPDQVRIRVEAVALGYVDGLIAQGRYQLQPAMPHSPGGEIAGVVDAVGPGVAGFAPGDSVFTWQLGGGMAEFAVVPAAEVEHCPADIPFAVVAAMTVDYPTSYYALFHRGQLQGGESILVLGAASGVGGAAIQLARQAGAFVVAAASNAEKRAHALNLGAHAAIDYTASDWRDELKRALPGGSLDVVFDPVGGSAFEVAFRSLGKLGRHLVVGFAAGDIPQLPANLALLKSASLVGVDVRHFMASDPVGMRSAREAMFGMIRSGELTVPIDGPLPLSQAAKALPLTQDRGRVGKIVVTPQVF